MSALESTEPGRPAPALPSISMDCAARMPPKSLTNSGNSTVPVSTLSAAAWMDLYKAVSISRRLGPPLASSQSSLRVAEAAWRSWFMLVGTPPLVSSGRAPHETANAPVPCDCCGLKARVRRSSLSRSPPRCDSEPSARSASTNAGSVMASNTSEAHRVRASLWAAEASGGLSSPARLCDALPSADLTASPMAAASIVGVGADCWA